MHLLRWLRCMPLFALLGCGDADEPTSTPDAGPSWYAEVKPLVDAKCGRCHVEGGIAPFPLGTAEQLAALAGPIRTAIDQGTMPPWLAKGDGVPLKYDISLTDAERSLLHTWLDLGGPEGDPAEESPPLELELGGLPSADVELRMPAPYTPDASRADEYRCFPVAWPYEDTVYVTGSQGRPDNAAVVHHQTFYVAGPEQADLVWGWDAEDERPGYPCFGGPTLSGADDDLLASALGGWAPGTPGVGFPEGTGLRVKQGSVVILQQHYNTLQGTEPDRSQVSFAVREEVETEAFYVPWMDLQWVLNRDAMLIPAGEAGVRHEFAARYPDATLFTIFKPPELDVSAGVRLHSALLHMHQLGREIRLSIRRAGGAVERLVTIPRWDFAWQREYFFETPVEVQPDDEIVVECWWDNTVEMLVRAGRDGELPRDVGFGEGTVDEMCVSFMYVTPL